MYHSLEESKKKDVKLIKMETKTEKPSRRKYVSNSRFYISIARYIMMICEWMCLYGMCRMYVKGKKGFEIFPLGKQWVAKILCEELVSEF